jgi:hypothetical protein
MKTHLVVPLVGLVIAFIQPTYAQEKDLADPQTTQKILALVKAFDEAHSDNDATLLPRYSRATRFLLQQMIRGRSLAGKPFRNTIQTCTSGGTLKTASPRSTRMPLT